MKFIFNCFMGICIGAGAILPGISSGVLCVIFGLYEKLLDSVLSFFKDIKGNIKFLTPILLGIFIGVVLFGNLLNYFFYLFPLQLKSIFIGLILLSIPTLIKEVTKDKKPRLQDILCFFISLGVGIGSIFLEKHLSINFEPSTNFLYLILCGFCMSIGIVVPGVSSTIILMLLGIYPIYLSSISTLYFPVLIPMGIGLLFGSLVFMKLTKYLLDKFYFTTFSAIIGFTLGSIFVLIPNLYSIMDIIISLLCIILGGFLVFLFGNRK